MFAKTKRIKNVLMIGFALVIGLLIITCALAWVFLDRAKEISHSVENDDVPGAFLYLRMSKSLGIMHSNVLKYLAGETDDEVFAFREEYKKFGESLAELTPLESDDSVSRQKLASIRALGDEYFTEINRRVFQAYDPDLEKWAFKTIDTLENTVGAELEILLDTLKEEEYAEALASKNLKDTLSDDVPGLRYYLELLDETGDMLSSLNEYVSGELDEVENFNSDSESFIEYYDLLAPLETTDKDKKNLEKIRKSFKKINATAEEVFGKYDPESKINALQVVDVMEREAFERLEEILAESAREEQVDATTSMANLNSSIDMTILVLILVAILSALIGVYVALKLSGLISGALSKVLQTTNAISRNDIDDAKDLLQKENHPSSNLRHFSEFDEVRRSLVKAVGDLSVANENNERQDWLKSGVSELNRKLSGEQPLSEMAKNSVDFICEYLEAPVGFIYSSDESEVEGEPKKLGLMAHYGVVVDKSEMDRKYSFETGEGLVGQCLLRKKTIERYLDDSERLPIVQSGIAHSNPGHIIVAPLLYEGDVEGVIELGCTKRVTTGQREFIQQIAPSLGIAMRVSKSRDAMAALLKQSQSQAEALEDQQVLLGVSNSQLKEKALELEQKQKALSEKNKYLERAQKDLERQAEELEKSSKYKSEFLANMSHELRSPLNSLLILAKMLSDNDDGNLTGKQVEYASVIHRSGRDLLNIINDVLDLSKIEAGKLDVVFEELLLDELMGEIGQQYQPVADEQGLVFNVENRSGIESFNSDPSRLRQIIVNLLSNAFKFTETGSVDLIVEQLPEGVEGCKGKIFAQDMVCFRVTDTGVGVAQDKQEEIFNAFCQEDGTTSRRYGGTGLGLSICRQLAGLLFGSIDISSSLGRGTSLYLYLPLKRALEFSTDSEQKSVEAPVNAVNELTLAPVSDAVLQAIPQQFLSGSVENESPQAGAALSLTDGSDMLPNARSKEKRLLIIEKNPFVHASLKKQGEEAGFYVVTAFDGGKGLQLAEALVPSAILISDDEAFIDGSLVLSKIKSNVKIRHIPVYVISSESKPLDEREMALLGAVGSTIKPIDNLEMRSIIEFLSEISEDRNGSLVIFGEDEKILIGLKEFIAADGLNIELSTDTSAISDFNLESFHCIVLNINNQTSLDYIRMSLCDLTGNYRIPVIIHSNEPLTESQRELVEELSSAKALSPVISESSLLLETSLFLHQVTMAMPDSQREILSEQLSSSDVLAGKSLLVVDDQVSNIFALTAILEQHGIHCTIANNGREALLLLEQNNNVDLILMDIMMPEMDGYVTMGNIRKMSSYQHVPIIALTAKSMPEDRAKCIAAGANDYITKPLDSEQLLQLLNIWLAQSPAQRPGMSSPG
ncbi:response regulator [Pseudoteredinibacter isoporae]|uniref:histidine kinase n=1 Tax=Pseudoteredinibacter isoporae TaxID=570281 RepID=A0A7X0JX81_9GAMM|nr:response regulator [Pseudoteredinibacter isoporae]MBB6523882.1 signal transduction histidine kinase/CheY-like chemotaxis protein [Pseudoteredinibacter isoporae]NHO89256.1 response regulator [Pseudoteredinibacter isoporae]NIB22059.1 response regulator [Pseudoteredinibacter isoporae]